MTPTTVATVAGTYWLSRLETRSAATNQDFLIFLPQSKELFRPAAGG